MFYDKYLVFDQNFKGFLTGNNFLSGNFENMFDQIFYNHNKIQEKNVEINQKPPFLKTHTINYFFCHTSLYKICSLKYVSKTLSDVEMISVDLK